MAELLPTVDELAERAEQTVRLALDAPGRGDVDLHDGSRLTALVSMQVGLASRVGRYSGDRVAAARLGTATGDDLDEIVADDFGAEGLRKDAVAATGVVRLARSPGRPATTIPQGSRFAVPASQSSPAVVFRTTRTVPVLLNETTVDLDVTAVEAGTAGNIADPAAVTQVLDVLPDTTWACVTPPAGTVFGGGDEREEDDTYRARLAVASPEQVREKGTLAAVTFGALKVPGVRFVQAVEPLDGTILLFVGDASYALPAALRAAVATELLRWRCLGVPVGLRPYTVVDVPVVATIYMARDLTAYSLDTLRESAVVNVLGYFSNRVNADEYFIDMIRSACARVHPEVQHVAVSAPATDQQRPAASSYVGLSTINRYRVTRDNVRVTFSNPTTV